jgi:hypothetical protein
MLRIYANAFMTATRTNTVKLRDIPPKPAHKESRWLPAGHWWLRPARDVDLTKL